MFRFLRASALLRCAIGRAAAAASSSAKSAGVKSPPKTTTTPSMQQWFSFKDKVREKRARAYRHRAQASRGARTHTHTQHPGFLLLFQLGDFYELFFDDAAKAASLVGLTLTKRRSRQLVSSERPTNRPSAGGAEAAGGGRAQDGKRVDIPMAGLPVASLNLYLEKFVTLGVRVAVCDQVESSTTAKQNKRIVQRDVTRLVTPGTLFDDWLPTKRQNFLAAVFVSRLRSRARRGSCVRFTDRRTRTHSRAATPRRFRWRGPTSRPASLR